MTHIKQQPGGQTHPQPDSQIAGQSSHNTTTQTTRTKRAPAFDPQDPILAILLQIKDRMAAARRQQKAIIKQQTVLLPQAVSLNQGADDLAEWMGGLESKVGELIQTLMGTQDEFSRG